MFLRSMLAGAVITLGCASYISVDGGIPGAFLFSIGILIVLIRRYPSFTGRVCYLEAEIESIKKIYTIIVFNIAGSAIMAILIRLAKPDIVDNAAVIFKKKMNEDIRVFFLGLLCSVFVFFAIDGYRRIESTTGKYLIVIICTMAFVLSGYEHSIANFGYYFLGMNGSFNIAWGFLFLVENVMGNVVGGIGIYQLEKYAKKKKKETTEIHL